MERILEQAKKVVEAAEVFMVSTEQTPVKFENNRLKHILSKQSQTVALRIIKKGKIGYSATNDLDDVTMLVNSAVETAEFGTAAKFEFPAASNYPQVDVYDPAIESVSMEQMLKLGEEMIDIIRGHTPDIACEGGLTKSTTTIKILNSTGGCAEYRKSAFSMRLEGTVIQDTDMLFVGEDESSCHPLTDTKTITSSVIRQLEWAKEQAEAPDKALPVIFTPNGVASALVSPLVSAFNGKNVYEGSSPVGDKLGKAVFDTKFCLRDDASIPFCPGSRPFDDEGVATRCTTLIENGMPAAFYYDLQTAALANTQSTGNGERNGGRLPSPSASVFVIKPGNTSFNEMLADIKEGLVIEYVMGAEQGNVLGGDFAGNVLLGYKIENGKITGRVKNTMVSGNIYQVLKDIAAIGSDSKWIGGSFSTPSLYIPVLSISSKK
ncbi:MAG: TldD/PmbA family protein [Dehalococcoidales bacterium]|nr:TldD/PmbA family protein [Dehalococcoidales bacterium]